MSRWRMSGMQQQTSCTSSLQLPHMAKLLIVDKEYPSTPCKKPFKIFLEIVKILSEKKQQQRGQLRTRLEEGEITRTFWQSQQLLLMIKEKMPHFLSQAARFPVRASFNVSSPFTEINRYNNLMTAYVVV